ncbi:MAG: glycogen debranching N-terminal domain-containing protein [Rubrivivax sp.]
MSTTRLQPPNAEAIRIGDQWYVAATAARADESPHVLKCDDSFALFDRFGDIRAFGAGEQGLYHEDTRFLSRLELTIDGVRPLFLGAAVKERNNLLIVELMNPDLRQGGRIVVPKGQLHVFRAKLLWEGACHEHIRITNHGLAGASLEVALSFDADFRDLFEVRGMPRTRHGRLAEPVRSEDGGIAFGYEGLDGQHRTARITFEPAPQRCQPHEAAWALSLEPQAEWHLFCTVACDFDTRVPQRRGRPPRERPPNWEAAIHANAQARAHRETAHCRLETSNPLLDRWIERSVSDLAMLTTELPTGPYPYAGVPWYSTVFGRDGLITARQMLWADPTLARGVLACLAARQATASDPARDAEPGKILHEARQCEMALTGEVPFERYYGTVDATPLFVALAGAYWRRSGDIDFARSLWPHVTAALEWIDRHGDRDGDGFVEYARRSAEGLVQQGWKDSRDSIFHADGALAEAPIALAEVQGYVYEAKLEAAALAEVLGEPSARRSCAKRPRGCSANSSAASGAKTSASTRWRWTAPSGRARWRPPTPGTRCGRGWRRPSTRRAWQSASSPATSSPAGASAPSRTARSATTRCRITTGRSGRTTTLSSPRAWPATATRTRRWRSSAPSSRRRCT